MNISQKAALEGEQRSISNMGVRNNVATDKG